MKNTYLIIGGIMVIGLGLLALWGGFGVREQPLLSSPAELVVYTSGGEDIDKGLLYLSFASGAGEARVQAFADFNGDGAFDSGEEIARGIPLRPRENWKSAVAVTLSEGIEDGIRIKVAYGGRNWEGAAGVSREDAGALLDLATVKNPEESMKGWGNEAHAGEPATQASRGDVPDITQRPAECAPTAAANNILSLAGEHGVSPEDLPTPTEIIDGLKGDMDWTPADGVLPDAFVRGKNEWAAKHGLPIRTEKVGDQHGASTLEHVLDAMAGGGASELRLKFGDASGRAVGGHMVTVTGVRAEGGQTFIDVNDPKSPEGTETYEVVGNEVIGYPFEGITVLSWGFVQRWEGTPTGTSLEPLTEEEVRGIKEFVGEKEKIKVIVVRGKKVAISQVHVSTGPECDSEANQFPHYHANTGSVTALDGSVLQDPGGCGLGKVRDVPVEEVEAPSMSIPAPSPDTPSSGGSIEIRGLEPLKTR